MSSQIYYKFKSNLAFDTLHFDGSAISVRELRSAIRNKCGLKSNDYDLRLQDTNGKVYATDQDLIQKYTSIIICRVPKMNAVTLKKKAVPAEDQKLDLIKQNVDLVNSNLSEDDKIKVMMQQSTDEYNEKHFLVRPKAYGVPPANYICHKCNNGGHWIHNCPGIRDQRGQVIDMKAVKRPTGIPQDFLIEVDPGTPGAYFTKTGKYMVPIKDAEAYALGKKEKRPFSKEENPPCPTEEQQQDEEVAQSNDTSREKARVTTAAREVDSSGLPTALTCPVCHSIFSDAVLVGCCGRSYCRACIERRVQERSSCPNCETAIQDNGAAIFDNTIIRGMVSAWRAGNRDFLPGVSPVEVSSTLDQKSPPPPAVDKPVEEETDVCFSHATLTATDTEESPIKEDPTSVPTNTTHISSPAGSPKSLPHSASVTLTLSTSDVVRSDDDTSRIQQPCGDAKSREEISSEDTEQLMALPTNDFALPCAEEKYELLDQVSSDKDSVPEIEEQGTPSAHDEQEPSEEKDNNNSPSPLQEATTTTQEEPDTSYPIPLVHDTLPTSSTSAYTGPQTQQLSSYVSNTSVPPPHSHPYPPYAAYYPNHAYGTIYPQATNTAQYNIPPMPSYPCSNSGLPTPIGYPNNGQTGMMSSSGYPGYPPPPWSHHPGMLPQASVSYSSGGTVMDGGSGPIGGHGATTSSATRTATDRFGHGGESRSKKDSDKEAGFSSSHGRRLHYRGSRAEREASRESSHSLSPGVSSRSGLGESSRNRYKHVLSPPSGHRRSGSGKSSQGLRVNGGHHHHRPSTSTRSHTSGSGKIRPSTGGAGGSSLVAAEAGPRSRTRSPEVSSSGHQPCYSGREESYLSSEVTVSGVGGGTSSLQPINAPSASPQEHEEEERSGSARSSSGEEEDERTSKSSVHDHPFDPYLYIRYVEYLWKQGNKEVRRLLGDVINFEVEDKVVEDTPLKSPDHDFPSPAQHTSAKDLSTNTTTAGGRKAEPCSKSHSPNATSTTNYNAKRRRQPADIRGSVSPSTGRWGDEHTFQDIPSPPRPHPPTNAGNSIYIPSSKRHHSHLSATPPPQAASKFRRYDTEATFDGSRARHDSHRRYHPPSSTLNASRMTGYRRPVTNAYSNVGYSASWKRSNSFRPGNGRRPIFKFQDKSRNPYVRNSHKFS